MESKPIVQGECCKVYPDGFQVRHMTKAEARTVIGWYSGICATSVDLEVAFDALGTDLQAFIGMLDDRPVASAVRTPASDGILYGSLFYVEPEQRKLGLGHRIRDEVAGQYVGGRIICIDAHEELKPMNIKRGYTEAFEVVHYTGKVLEREGIKSSTDIEIITFLDSLFDQLMAYDDKCFVTPGSAQRRKLMKLWVRIPGSRTMLAVKRSGGQREVIGFVCRRPASQDESNHIIGPLYAENQDVATNLVSAVTDDIIGQNIWMTVCSPHQEAVKLVTDLQLKEDIHMIRMYKNGVVEPPNNRVFAITSIDICGF